MLMTNRSLTLILGVVSLCALSAACLARLQNLLLEQFNTLKPMLAATSIDPQPHLMSTLVFWTCLTLLFYVYVLYPLTVRVLAARLGVPVRRGAALPSVTIIVTAYNEERCIRAKLDNISQLDYPPTLLSTVVVSDASSDATEEIARHYDPARVSVLRVEGRRGKTACQNAAAAVARGDVLIFTDATTQLHPQALRRLVENFADSEVGCVSGRVVYVTRDANVTGQGCETYWDYEQRLRATESAFGSMIGVAGCLYAVRRCAYVPLD